MIKAIKEWFKNFRDPNFKDPAFPIKTLSRSAPPLPTQYENTPWGTYEKEFLIWAFGEIPRDKPQSIYIELWDKKYGNLLHIPNEHHLADYIPKMHKLWMGMKGK